MVQLNCTEEEREGGREGMRKGERKGGMEVGREGGRKNGRKGERKGGMTGGREGVREGEKDPFGPSVKDSTQISLQHTYRYSCVHDVYWDGTHPVTCSRTLSPEVSDKGAVWSVCRNAGAPGQ